MPRAKKQLAQEPYDFNFFYLLITAILFIGFCGMFLSVNQKYTTSKDIPQIEEASLIIDTKPKLKEGAVIPQFSAKGIYVIDIDTSDVLFTKNENTPVLPASTTKIATAIVAMNHYQPDEILTVNSLKGATGSTMGLKIGEEITALNLFYGLLVQSANDAAYVLSDNFPGGREAFLTSMNGLVVTHNLGNTHFTNPVGFDEYLHFSTASDLAVLAMAAYRSPLFAEIVKTEKYQASSVSGSKHNLVTTNKLLGEVPGVIGIKTGQTATSGESLITLVEREDKKILFSVIGSQDRFGETRTLIDWIFENYYSTTGTGVGSE